MRELVRWAVLQQVLSMVFFDKRLMISAGVVWAACTISAQSAVAGELDDCMVQAMRTVSDNTTVGE